MKIKLIKVHDIWVTAKYRRFRTPVYTEINLFLHDCDDRIVFRLNPRILGGIATVPALIQIIKTNPSAVYEVYFLKSSTILHKCLLNKIATRQDPVNDLFFNWNWRPWSRISTRSLLIA